MHEQHRPVRIGQNVFDQPVASAPLRIGEPIKWTVTFRVFDPMIEVSLFLVTECFPVADQELKIARVWLINGGVIDFVDDAVAQREPDPATGMISGAETLLGAGCPTRRDTGRAEGGGMFGRYSVHDSVQSAQKWSIITPSPKTIASFECVRIVFPCVSWAAISWAKS